MKCTLNLDNAKGAKGLDYYVGRVFVAVGDPGLVVLATGRTEGVCLTQGESEVCPGRHQDAWRGFDAEVWRPLRKGESITIEGED